MMDEETRMDVVEAKEALDRADERWLSDNPGSARRHMIHALVVLERILKRNAKDEGDAK